jgi:hypothetical protein
MRFEIKHQFDAPLSKIEEAMLSPEYLDYLLQHHDVLLEVQPKTREETDREVKRTVRYLPKPVIEKIGTKRVPPEWFAFIEQSTYDRGRRRMDFENIPTSQQIRRMLVNKGSITLREAGPNRTERVVEGDLKLMLPFLLKPLAAIGERVIHSEAVKLLDGEAKVLKRWLTERTS